MSDTSLRQVGLLRLYLAGSSTLDGFLAAFAALTETLTVTQTDTGPSEVKRDVAGFILCYVRTQAKALLPEASHIFSTPSRGNHSSDSGPLRQTGRDASSPQLTPDPISEAAARKNIASQDNSFGLASAESFPLLGTGTASRPVCNPPSLPPCHPSCHLQGTKACSGRASAAGLISTFGRQHYGLGRRLVRCRAGASYPAY